MKAYSRIKNFAQWQFIILAIVVSTMMIVGGYVYYRYDEKTIRNEKYNELKAIAESKIDEIVSWRKERVGDAVIISKSNLFQTAVEKYLTNKQNPVLKKSMLDHLSLFKTQYQYKNLLITTLNGKAILSLDSNIKSFDTISIPFINKVFEQKEVMFSDFYFSRLYHQILLDIIAPITNEKNKPIAALILRIDPAVYLYPLMQSWPMPSGSAETLIIRKDDDSALYMNELRHISNTALKLRVSLTNKKIPAVQAVLGHVGIFEGKDYRGVDVISDIRSVPGTPWFMVAKVDKSEIFSELYYRLIIIIVFISLLIFLLVAALAWFYYSRQQNIYKQLLDTGNALQESQDEFKTTLYSIGDAVITTDINGFVRNMNPVAEKLTGWNESDAKNKELEKIFQIVNEETRDKVENPVHKILREGLVVGLANHTLLISKDGKEMPIADSGAPIKNTKGEIMGVVLVFRDQTNERKAEQNLRESEEKFRNVFEHSIVGKSITQLDGKLKTNKAYCHILGYTNEELLNMKWQELTHKDDIENDQKIIESIIKGEKAAAHWEKRYIHKNGNIVWVDISTTLQRDNEGKPLYFITSIIDITERKRAEDAIRQSRKELDNLFEASPELISFVGFDGYFKRLNPAWVKTLGYPMDKLLSIPFIEFVHPDDREATNAEAAKLAEGQRTIQFDNRYRCNDGSYRWLSWSVIPDITEKLLYAVTRDITERKLSEQESEYQFALLTALINSPRDIIIFSLDKNYCYTTFNEKHREEMKLVWNTEIKVGMNLLDLMSVLELREAAKKSIDQALKGEAFIEIQHQPEFNTYYEFSWNPILQNEEVVGITVFIRDITERKHFEEAIQKSEEQYRTLVEQASDGIFLSDAKGQYIEVNSAGCRLLGYTREEILLKTLQELTHNTKDTPIKLDELRAGKSMLSEREMIRKDGSLVPVEISAKQISGGRFQGIVRDITERKVADQELHEREARYRTLVENIPQKILMKDRNYRWVSINENLARDFGFKPEDVVGKLDSDLFSPELATKYHSDDVRIMETGKTEELEEKYMVAGKESWVNTIKTPVRDLNGEIVGLLGIFWDITGRKQAEEEIKDNEKRFRELIESLPQLFWTTRVDGPCDYLSKQWIEYTGIPEAEQLGYRWLEQLHPDDKERTVSEWMEKVKTGDSFDIEFRIRRNDGEYHWFKTRAVPMHDAEGNIIKWFGSNTDFDDIKKAEERLYKLNSDLERSNKELEQFAYVASHDLQEPLRMISSFTQLLYKRYNDKLDKDANEFIEYIVDGADRMQRLIQDLLSFSRITTRGGNFTQADTHQALGEAILNLQILIKESGAIITNENLPVVFADYSQVVQLFQNFIGNSIKFRSEESPHIHISSKLINDELVFSVKDNGIGIDPMYFDRIFVIFQRLNAGKQYPGTGIGLAICHRIVQRHEGKIWVESLLGKGSVFHFTLKNKETNHGTNNQTN